MSPSSATWWVQDHQLRRIQDAKLTNKQLPFTIIRCRTVVKQPKSLAVCVMTGESDATAVKASRVPTAAMPGMTVSQLSLAVDGRIQTMKLS